MFKKLSLEEKIKIKTRSHQLLIFLITFAAVFGGYKIKFLADDPLPWLFIILILAFLSIMLDEILKKWLYATISDSICSSIFHTSSASDKIIKETSLQENVVYKHIKLLKESIIAIEKLKSSSVKTKQSAVKVAEKSQESLEWSNKEQKSVETNIEKMNTLKQKIEIIADLILELSEYTQQIGSIIGVVEDITEQTNMLALNAAVEAARAGEHGKGFAVVASEIRKLADESKQATNKITSLIYDIQQATNSTVMATEEGTKEIESGVDLTQNIAQNIQKIKMAIHETVNSVDQIVKDSDYQLECTTNAHNAVIQLDEGLAESAEKIKQNLLALNDLLKTSENLKDSVIGIDYKMQNKLSS
ncbi:MAG TPA: methyl-accepting chemotaxis protein [Candidatus Gastranaerophilales bacterium]|nr:methyl-accepting chemotaxis protein [Candidatus Gastranaerophilales bacterium]